VLVIIAFTIPNWPPTRVRPVCVRAAQTRVINGLSPKGNQPVAIRTEILKPFFSFFFGTYSTVYVYISIWKTKDFSSICLYLLVCVRVYRLTGLRPRVIIIYNTYDVYVHAVLTVMIAHLCLVDIKLIELYAYRECIDGKSQTVRVRDRNTDAPSHRVVLGGIFMFNEKRSPLLGVYVYVYGQAIKKFKNNLYTYIGRRHNRNAFSILCD